MSYQFLDANGSVLTAQSSVIGGVHYPVVISSVFSPMPVAQSGTWISSIAGTPNIGSVVGALLLYAQPTDAVSAVSSVVTSTGSTSVLGAPGASLRNYVTAIKVTNAAANGAIVDIKDNTTGTVMDTGYAAASGGGWSSSFPMPVRQVSTNASIDVVPRSQASILVTISGFKAT